MKQHQNQLYVIAISPFNGVAGGVSTETTVTATLETVSDSDNGKTDNAGTK